MDPKVKREWVAALRSGEYKQTRSQLCDGTGAMCCLGVLIDATQDGEWDQIVSSMRQGWSYNGVMGGLPFGVLKAVGLTLEEEAILIDLNDTKRRSFRTIANYIEAKL